MSATAPSRADMRLDVSGTSKVSLTTLVKVEIRKMIDTRAGLWLLIAIAALTAVVAVIFLLNANEADRTFSNMMGIAGTPQGFLLPVLGILLVTQEWGQRTGMVTFALEPNRSRVITAKVIAALAFGFAAVIVAIVVGVLATVLFGGPDVWAGIGPDDFGKYFLLQGTGVLQGLAFGLLLLNSAAAIVLYYVIPIAFSILTGVWSALRDAQPWIDLGTAQTPLFENGHMTGEQWAQLGTTSLIWVIVPFVLGLWRVMRAEVK